MILASLKEISADQTAFIIKEMAGDKNGREFSNMKTYTEATTLAIQNDAPIQSSQASFEVCMHVLGPTRTDARVMRAATALAENGYAVTIIDVENGKNQAVEEEISGICVKHIRVSNSFTSTRFTRWPLLRAAQMFIHATLRLLRTPTDVYHAHDVHALPACYIASRLRRKPLVFDSHELPSPEIMTIHWRWVHVFLNHLLKYILPRCTGVITVSAPIAEEIQKRYRAPGVLLIRNVPGYRAMPRSDKLQRRLNLDPGTRIALYQGHIQTVRRLDLLIHAAKFLDEDIVVAIMGNDVEGILPELEALVAREEVTDRVKFLPPVPYQELLEWTASADIGLIVYAPDCSLNIQLCLPNKLFEYLMAGVPILASTLLEATSDVLRAHDAGKIISSLTPVGIAACINAMLADSVALERMRRNALKAAQEEFHWEKESQKLVQLYREILARQKAM